MPEVVPIAESDAQPLTLALWAAGVIERWRTVILTAVVTVALAVAAALILPPAYRVTVSFATNSSSSSKLSGLTGSSALAGLAGSLGMPSLSEPSESPAFYTELLQSRELLTRLLQTRFPDPRTANPADSARLVDIMKLRSTEPKRRLELGVKQLRKDIRTESDIKTNVTKVTVSNRYPELVAAEANTSLALVNSFNIEQRASRARSKRIYLENRLSEARRDLEIAQGRYRDFLASNRQWRQSPMLSSDEETLRRAEDVATDLYLSLEKQYESARLDEFNDAALITVVDSAVAPQRPDWPRYVILIPAALIGGAILGVIIAGVATVYADWTRREPLAAHRLRAALHRRHAPPTEPTQIPRRA